MSDSINIASHYGGIRKGAMMLVILTYTQIGVWEDVMLIVGKYCFLWLNNVTFLKKLFLFKRHPSVF